jgi:hypothetical protein
MTPFFISKLKILYHSVTCTSTKEGTLCAACTRKTKLPKCSSYCGWDIMEHPTLFPIQNNRHYHRPGFIYQQRISDFLRGGCVALAGPAAPLVV